MIIGMETITLSDEVKASLTKRLKPIVEAGAVPFDESVESKNVQKEVQSIVGGILKEELPQDVLKHLQAIQDCKEHTMLIKNMPTLDTYLPPTPQAYGVDNVGGYSNLILMGMSALEGQHSPSATSIVARSISMNDDNHVAVHSKHRDSPEQNMNALYCLKGEKVATNFFSFNDIATHPDIAPHLDTLMQPLFEEYKLPIDPDKALEKTQEATPLIQQYDDGTYAGTEMYKYRKSSFREVRGATAQAQEAWETLETLTNQQEMQPSDSVILDKGDMVVFQEILGIHDRDAYVAREAPDERRWLKRADRYHQKGAVTLKEDSEALAVSEQALPELIAQRRQELGMDASSISCPIR